MTAALANSLCVGMMHLPSTGERRMATSERATEDLDRRLCVLMIDVQGGDRHAYAEVLRACEPVIRRAGRRAGVTDDRLNDVVQETLLTLHHARQTFDPSRSFLAWISVIAQRRAIDVMRRHGRNDRREVHAPLAYESHADAGSNSDRGWEQSGRVKILGAAIASLPDGQREAVERLALREQSLTEAAAETGKTTGALKVNLHRALKALRLRLGGESEHV
ncbi:sigma-70 family RNA polymerase sigma factor [Beijerinckia sp. L45]|uniref:sigma-70 family RNA polymerase sigma factor n=1 Tax=Beijerinckia sp. L45 TaxID=1641855 RepID=UPI001FEEFC23|nr:sigma-70 family RNA polymerase sigma factor [Beijerinckia sp. L45]